MDTLFALKLEHRLAKAFDFNIASIFSFKDSNSLYESNDTLIEHYHKCGTAACIVGHARLELNNNSLKIDQLYTLLNLPSYNWPTYSLFEQALGFRNASAIDIYWCKLKRTISGQHAADLIRHIRLHQNMPNSFSEVEKFYSACDVYKRDGNIIYTANALNITGYGSTKEQAILDYVEQLIYKDTGIRQNVSS